MIIIVLLAAALRLAMLFSTKSLWGDEFYSIEYAFQPTLRDLFLFCWDTNHPPLYYLVLRAAGDIFGRTELVLRLFSAIPGILLVWAVYRFGKLVFSKGAAVLCALLTAVSPYFIQESNEVRSYSLLALLSVMTVYFLLRAEKKGKYALHYAVCGVALLYLEHLGLFTLAVTKLYALCRRMKRFWTVHLSMGVLLVPWFLLILHQAIDDEKVHDIARVQEYWFSLTWQVKKAVGFFWHHFSGYTFSMLSVEGLRESLRSPFFILHALVVMGGILVILFAAAKLFRSDRRTFWFLMSLALLPFAVFVVIYPVRLSARYMSASAPFIFCLLAYGIAKLPRPAGKIFLVIFLALGLHSDFYYLSLKTDAMHREDLRGMVEYVGKRVDRDTAVVGSRLIYDFYGPALGLPYPPPVAYYGTSRHAADFRDAKKAWVYCTINIEPETTKRMLADEDRRMGAIGFTRKDAVRFGGEEGQAFALLYTRDEDPEKVLRAVS